ncbi:hypothetical protein [Actinotalea sp. K2]|uniref:hypothetical protein n=1 Tax=Actinotalea sp. K2 TaxID=2939438 RepID=UPI002016CF0A|nr:hypothetical protein [Actinotalea sp. K2]MCL3862172.1 hypothetical protein [Actinotalea sp. K2]
MSPRPHGADAPDHDDGPDGRSEDSSDQVEPAAEPDRSPTEDEIVSPDRPEDDTFDARWAAIVERLGDLDTGDDPGSVPEGPADEPQPTGRERPSDRRSPADQTETTPEVAARPTAPRGWSPDEDVEEAETHFTPPEPGPVLGGEPLLTLAWSVVVAVPLLLLLVVVFWQDAPDLLLQLAGGAFLLACGLLVWRMPHRRDDDEGPGAVV